MTQTNRIDAIDKRKRQEKFADSLIECLGVDGAIRACRANVWDGVLGLVLSDERCTGEGPGDTRTRAVPGQADRSMEPVSRGLQRGSARPMTSVRLPDGHREPTISLVLNIIGSRSKAAEDAGNLAQLKALRKDTTGPVLMITGTTP